MIKPRDIDPENLDPMGPQNHALSPMSEGARKVAMIADLPAAELEGWVKCVKFTNRPYLPGERAALFERARDLKMKVTL